MIRGEIRGDDDQMMVEAEVDAIVKMEMLINNYLKCRLITLLVTVIQTGKCVYLINLII